MKEKFKNIINQIKFNNYNNKMDSLLTEYQDCKNELFKIFSEVSSNNKISAYKLTLLNLKLKVLTDKINNILNEAKTNKKHQKENFLYSNLLFLTSAVVLTAICPIELLLFNYLLYLFISMFLRLKMENFYNSKEFSEMTEKNNDVYILIENCETFMNKHLKNTKEKQKTSISDIEDIELADEIIKQYLESGFLKENIDFNIESLVIKLLQDELNTEESDMKTLLDMAKKNLDEEKNKVSNNNNVKELKIKKSD